VELAGARQAVEERWFGKRILVTDHDHWSIADLTGAYRASPSSKNATAS
jgi:hypothetical protein